MRRHPRCDADSRRLQKLFLTSIAFKLVQKNNSMNRLFKIAVCVRGVFDRADVFRASLPAIFNLFLLWGVFFITCPSLTLRWR